MTDNTDTPRTPRALPTPEAATDSQLTVTDTASLRPAYQLLTREQIAEALRSSYDGDMPEDAKWEPDDRDLAAADAVLTLIDKENTMPDEPSVSIPVDALRNIAARIHDGDGSNAAHDLLSWIHEPVDPPKPPAPRLRVVNLDDSGTPWPLHIDDLEAQPDVLPVIYDAVDEWWVSDATTKDSLKARIHAALRAASGS